LDFRVYIPVRYGSTRLPGKPLADIAGKPLIQHVHERALESGASAVIIATDDERIRACALGFGARVCMTSAYHRSGTERLAEAAAALKEDEDAIIVNLQGDEPRVVPALLAQVAGLLDDRPGAELATLCAPLGSAIALRDPNIVKAVVDREGYALYFSRAPIPWDREHFGAESAASEVSLADRAYLRHLGLYAYRVKTLKRLARLEPCVLEHLEALEQLRALYYGYRVAVTVVQQEIEPGVDTPSDLEYMRRVFAREHCARGAV